MILAAPEVVILTAYGAVNHKNICQNEDISMTVYVCVVLFSVLI